MSRHYLLDSNVFITANQQYYKFETCPGFWDFLRTNAQVGSLTDVHQELKEKDDVISRWARTLPKDFFVKSDDASTVYAEVVQYVEDHQQYQDAGKVDFLAKADPWIVAFAEVHKLTVVTTEVYSPECKRRVPIPNICRHFGVKYMNTFELLGTLGARFVLQS